MQQSAECYAERRDLRIEKQKTPRAACSGVDLVQSVPVPHYPAPEFVMPILEGEPNTTDMVSLINVMGALQQATHFMTSKEVHAAFTDVETPDAASPIEQTAKHRKVTLANGLTKRARPPVPAWHPDNDMKFDFEEPVDHFPSWIEAGGLLRDYASLCRTEADQSQWITAPPRDASPKTKPSPHGWWSWAKVPLAPRTAWVPLKATLCKCKDFKSLWELWKTRAPLGNSAWSEPSTAVREIFG